MTRETEQKLAEALRWTLEWIDAVPSDTPLPVMPGFDRDYVNGLLAAAPSPDTGKMGGDREAARQWFADAVAYHGTCGQGGYYEGCPPKIEHVRAALAALSAPVSGVGMPASVKELLGFVEWALENEQPVNPEHIVALSDAVKDAYRAPVSGGEGEAVACSICKGVGTVRVVGSPAGDVSVRCPAECAHPSDPDATERMRAALKCFPVDADFANAERFRDAVNVWWDTEARAALGEA